MPDRDIPTNTNLKNLKTGSKAKTSCPWSRYLWYITLGVLIITLVALGWLAYAYRELDKANAALKEAVATRQPAQPAWPASPEPWPLPEPTEYYQPSEAFIDNTTAVFNTMNTQPLEQHMAEKVTLYYSSPNPAVKLAPTQATLALDYLSDGKEPWNLRLSEVEIAKYKATAGYNRLFGKGCLTGRSASNQYLVSLCFTKAGKIHAIFMTRDASKVFY